MRPITFICAFFQNQGMLREQQERWRSLPATIREHLHVIVVDDCSPTEPALPVVVSTGLASFRLYRTLKKVRWNWLFARNLGVDQATTNWVLLTDVDHAAPAETLQRLMTGPLEEDVVYRFSRVDAPNLTPYKPHPNSWFMTRRMFDRIGGYDEDFSGAYGSDSEFRERVHRSARAVVMLPEPLVRYPRECIADASTTMYERKTAEDRELMTKIRDRHSRIPDWKPRRLTFPWEHQITIQGEACEQAARS